MNNSVRDNIKILIAEGEKQIESGNFDSGISFFIRVLQLDPKNIIAMNNLGICCRKSRNPENAIKWYKKTLKMNPYNAQAWYEMGLCLVCLSLYDKAVNCFKHAIENDPMNLEAWEKRSECYRLLNNESYAVYCDNEIKKIKIQITEDKTLEISDNIGTLKSSESKGKDIEINIQNCIWHGLDCLDSKQYDEAIIYFNKGLEFDPKNSDLMMFKGLCNKKINNPIESKECLKNIDWDTFFFHAFRYYKANEFKKALRYFEKGIEINPADPDLWDNKGLCLEQLGKTDEALCCYEHAKDLDIKLNYS